MSFIPGSHKKEKILESVEVSLSALKVSAVNIEYLHAPDRTVPFEETLKAVNQAYQDGKFKSFGLSNYTADEVEQIVQICQENGYCKPRVYQGQYNAVVRSGEKELFPVLRKHGIAFYAWRCGASSLECQRYTLLTVEAALQPQDSSQVTINTSRRVIVLTLPT